MTPIGCIGSRFFSGVIALVISLCCGTPSEAGPPAAPRPTADARSVAAPAVSPARPEATLGVVDRGLWSDLDAELQLVLPEVPSERVTATVDTRRRLLVLAIDGFPRKVYPLTGTAKLAVGSLVLELRPGDHAELAPLLAPARVTERGAAKDRDQDGIPDPLDVLIGARKTVLNAAAYTDGYVRIAYPMGDVPRATGVCTDVVIRAVRNAGLDLQKALHDDIRRAPRAYPMVKGRGNPNIDHRRVATLLPYFQRHWDRRSAKLDDPDDPLRPGDVIFMDTLGRPGPDHIGILSDQIGESGLPLVINNWTTGTVTAEMDLLGFVPVLYRFRLPPS